MKPSARSITTTDQNYDVDEKVLKRGLFSYTYSFAINSEPLAAEQNARGFFQLVIDVEKERQRPHAKKSSSQEIILAKVYGVTIFYT